MKKIAGLLIIAIGSRLTAQEVTDKFVPVTQKDLNTPDPADWLMLGGNMEHWNLDYAHNQRSERWSRSADAARG